MDGQTRFTCGQSGPLSGRKAHRLTSTVHVDDMDACDSKQTDKEDPDQEKVARESGDAAPKTKPQLEPELKTQTVRRMPINLTPILFLRSSTFFTHVLSAQMNTK